MKTLLTILIALTLVSCNDSTNSGRPAEPNDAQLLINGGSSTADVPIDFLEPDDAGSDTEPSDPCLTATVSDVELYCSCFRQCCRTQRWYCPPNPNQTIDVANVTVEVCDENKVPCQFGVDADCPPPEILSQSECYTAYECPPGSTGEFLQWFECQLENGQFGRQRVLCDKGNLIHGPCRPCDPESCDGEDNDCDNLVDEGRFACQTECGEGWGFCVESQVVDCSADSPGDELCNFEDDDCDGIVDEGQRNACDLCGPLEIDTCDGIDNDCDNSIDESLVRECETICNRGIEICENGNWISCTAQQPADEECDGEDNDCDGMVDENLQCLCEVEDVGVLMPCSEPPLLCGQGFKTCACVDPDCQELYVTDCAALCQYLPPQNPQNCNPLIGITLQQEECNNFDEDCDQQIDEDLIQACYSGDPETLFVGVCTPGEVYCEQGSWGNERNGSFTVGYCAGEVTPSEEICDGADNDCDGEVDYGEEIRDTDILFIVDWSASMSEEIRAVRTALNSFAQQFAAEEPLQWGLAIAPQSFRDQDQESLVLVSDISPFDQFLNNFSNLGNDGMEGSLEMLIDAIYLSVRNISPAADLDPIDTVWVTDTGSIPRKENFSITWRPDSARIVIVFSDEPPQTYLRLPASPNRIDGPLTDAYMENVVQSAVNFKLYTFSRSSIIQDGWETLAQASGGSGFTLTSDARSMYTDLMSIIDEACLPRQAEQGAFNGPMMGYAHVKYDYNYMICR